MRIVVLIAFLVGSEPSLARTPFTGALAPGSAWVWPSKAPPLDARGYIPIQPFHFQEQPEAASETEAEMASVIAHKFRQKLTKSCSSGRLFKTVSIGEMSLDVGGVVGFEVQGTLPESTHGPLQNSLYAPPHAGDKPGQPPPPTMQPLPRAPSMPIFSDPDAPGWMICVGLPF